MKSCPHNSTRADGWLDDHCLLCGTSGYWRNGRRVAEVSPHPGGHHLLKLPPKVNWTLRILAVVMGLYALIVLPPSIIFGDVYGIVAGVAAVGISGITWMESKPE